MSPTDMHILFLELFCAKLVKMLSIITNYAEQDIFDIAANSTVELMNYKTEENAIEMTKEMRQLFVENVYDTINFEKE